MSWNYRVIHVKKHVHLANIDEDTNYYEIRSVYYTGPTPDGIAPKPFGPGGETPKEFLGDWRLLRRALSKAVLIWDEDQQKFLGEEPPLIQSK